MYSVTLPVTLTLEGPVLSKSTSMGGYGLDAVMAKNSKEEYYLPGTLIKGRLRQAIDELSAVDSSLKDFNNIWLGKETGNTDNQAPVDPIRTKLNFSDFVYKKPATTEDSDNKNNINQTIHRIKIDRERGSVEKGALLVMDAPFAVGAHIDFSGEITFTAEDENEIDNVKKCIETGLRWIPAFGGEKSVGFGKLLTVHIAEPEQKAINIMPHTKVAGNEIVNIIIKPDSPFCFAKRQVTKNLFESDDIIPGSAIKGALVSTWVGMLGKTGDIKVDPNFDSNRKELSENLGKIRFTHAFPVQDTQNKRPVVAPLSLVKTKNKSEDKEVIYDVIFQESAILIDGHTPPAFAIDWKGSRSDVDKIFGWDKKPKRELRIRTAIDREKRKAEDKKLFAYEMVDPKGFKWASRIDLSRVDQSSRAEIESQLREILLSVGLVGMSKTKISAEIEFPAGELKNKIKSKCESIDRGKNKYWVITLQTPAILCNPANLNETSTSQDLLSEYKTVWDKISGDTLELSHFFATQSLAGGYYLHKRFQREKPYRPYLLTDAGSVFILKETTYAGNTINKWFKYGLDFPEWAKKEYSKKIEDQETDGGHWRNCPYIPENGYGEIAVNIHKYFPEEITVYGQ